MAGPPDAEVPITRLSPRTASSRTDGSVSNSFGTMEVNVFVARSKANSEALLASPPPDSTLPAPKKTVLSVAATALARVALGSGTPRLVRAPVAGSYSQRAGGTPGRPPTE
ncbi:hypothetical protein [Streptomyces sp. NPDC088115]|uniref:hypothetical protein n=1 Tax=Streptomyces sp. NPDC088115 TaxID=3365824 RepID=UPI00382E76B5